MMNRIRSSMALKVSLILLVLLLAVALVVGSLSLYFYQRDEYAMNGRLAQAIATTTVAGIDGDAYEALTETYEANDYWYELEAMFNEIKTETDAMYLYALNNDVDGSIRYVVEGSKPGDELEYIGMLGDQDDPGAFGEETFTALETGKPLATGAYDSGGYGSVISGFAPVFNSQGQVVGVVGADISLQSVINSIISFALQIILVAVVVSILAGAFVVRFINNKVGRPLRQLLAASEQIAVGDMRIELTTTSQDEVGHLAQAFGAMVDSTKQQVSTLTRIADNDYTEKIALRSEQDELNRAIRQILQNNIALISGIRESSEQVNSGAAQIAASSQAVASGATEQAATLEEFNATISDVYQQAKENTQLTESALTDMSQASQLMDQSAGQMKQMSSAMAAIQTSSEDIAKVIKVIDDIAFQTNILALNAAVEAARAGQHGKGFAVVADEVRNLAQKSADAAKETATMIETSVQNVQTGGEIVQEIEESMAQVAEISAGNAQSVQGINELSQKQSAAIHEVTQGVDQLSSVVQANSATAEESAASAQQMSAQAEELQRMVAQFRLPEVGGNYPALLP